MAGPPAGRSSLRQSLVNDENGYDLEALAVSDGFRFNQSQQQQHEQHDPQTVNTDLQASPPRQSIIQNQYSSNNPPPRPSSISKPKLAPDNFALRHDGAMGHSPSISASATSQSNQSSSLNRASSVSTVSTQSPIIRSEGPYQGPSGPSFPYQMYPQNTRPARTMSVATTSTAAVPERPYDGPAAPTHPYGMYPQNITPDSTVGLTAAAAIPVGFPGLNNDYQRRIGPEGEEAADIIGSDGHTEQLPPYTQYPDEALARKARGVAPIPTLMVDAGAGGIGLATRNPEFDSPRDEASSPLARADRASTISRGSSQQTGYSTTPNGGPEKPELKHWQVVAKRKVCGIVPIWVFAMIGLTLILMAAILAGVLSALKPKHPDRQQQHGPPPESETQPQTTVYSTVTTTFDATPTTVASTFPTLPTGSFQLNLGSAQSTQTDCIHDSTQLNAWTCQAPPIGIQINVTTNETTNEHKAIFSAPSYITSWNYGTQFPIIQMERKLDLVIDMENPSYGPAWFFQVPYNKLVVLYYPMLPDPSNPSQKRQFRESPSTHLNRKAAAQPGDKAWFCYWNGTLLETFIYANQTSSAGAHQTSSSQTVSTTSASSSHETNAVTSTRHVHRKRQSSGGGSGSPSNPSGQPFLPGYPKIVKIEERRIPEGSLTSHPSCTLMEIGGDGSTATPITNSSGQAITVQLNESDPTLEQMSAEKRSYTHRPSDLMRRETPGDCSCLWQAS